MATEYSVVVCEPEPLPGFQNVDALSVEAAPPCPLCGSAWVSVMAHHGPYAAWLECFLGHCVRLDWDEDGKVHHVELTDKPRYVMAMSWNIEDALVLTGRVQL